MTNETPDTIWIGGVFVARDGQRLLTAEEPMRLVRKEGETLFTDENNMHGLEVDGPGFMQSKVTSTISKGEVFASFDKNEVQHYLYGCQSAMNVCFSN